MKILESSPRRYDRGIALLSFGASERVKHQLVEEHVRDGSRILEIGCGTGTMAILAATKGGEVTGFDISRSMLDVARTKIETAGLSGSIRLLEMGVSGMADLETDSYDAVFSTLVFSELSVDEQSFALKQAYRVLRTGGTLAIADEVTPRLWINRLLYRLIRLPLSIITFLVTQTTTRAVEHLSEDVEAAGFSLVAEQRSGLGSFLRLTARKECTEGVSRLSKKE
jgi:demethylmenaquinone methyltransferase/2-methoxy-6-polyprenyl-1,4-benzoquinol methylase